MSVCPPYAPFFGFAGVTATVSLNSRGCFVAHSLTLLVDGVQQYVIVVD
jgi:hypothetical protein